MRKTLVAAIALAAACTTDLEPGDDASVRVEPDGGMPARDVGGHSPDTADSPDSPDSPDSGTPRDVAGDDASPGADVSEDDLDSGSTSLTVPATTGQYEVSFSIGIQGQGSGRIGAVEITSGSGSLEIAGESLPVAVYERQEWAEFGYNLYQAIALRSDRLHAIWFYCRDGDLAWVWEEATDGTQLDVFAASGTCDESAAPSTVAVDFPAAQLPDPPIIDRFEVTGSSVAIAGTDPGSVKIGASTFDVYVFGLVDCTIDCGSPGWHELHAVLWDPARRWLCFAIFYLFLDGRPPLLTYAFSLPSLTAPFGTVQLDGATWVDTQ